MSISAWYLNVAYTPTLTTASDKGAVGVTDDGGAVVSWIGGGRGGRDVPRSGEVGRRVAGMW
jgi:hypothetical protein